MDNPETAATLGTQCKDKLNKNAMQKAKKMSNTDPTK